MKIKILFLLPICIFLGMLINKHNELINIPKEERQLIQVSEKAINGRVEKVVDGDSFILDGGTRIRLFGVDAPELEQICILTVDVQSKDPSEHVVREEEIHCGENSKNKLNDLISSQEVSCIIKGKDAYDRFVGECSFEKYNARTKRRDKININKEMVLSGNAVAFQQISDKYIEDESRAKSENRGIWSTTFDMPSVYRKKNIK